MAKPVNQLGPLCFLLVYLCASSAGSSSASAQEGSETASLLRPYREVASQIIEGALSNKRAYARLSELCDGIGHRLSGSEALNKAIRWAEKTLRNDGHENVRAEPVRVPRWVRGDESLRMISPMKMKLPMLGLGGSVATPRKGITAEVVIVSNEEELEALGKGARGKIVLFNNPMPPYHPVEGSGYGETVRFRLHGARLASEHGAVGVLVRSVTANSQRTPHTGVMIYGKARRKIPAAAVTIEDAEMIARLIDRGERVKVRLFMEAHREGKVPSANVVAELRGSTLPDEIVVISGHLDSWDVGQGAHDDATGCIMAMESLRLLREAGLRPRRTIRVVLWTNEENGLAGGRSYAKEHADELAQHVAAIESDSGGFDPRGFNLELEDTARHGRATLQLQELLKLLELEGSLKVKSGHSGSDIRPMKAAGVPLLGLKVEGSRYFDYHHTHADTVDKVDPDELNRCVALMAFTAYVLADMPGRLGENW